LYSAGDLLVMPRKFGGLCLPIGEASAAGMPVLMSDVAPQNGLLAEQLLVPARLDRKAMAKVSVDVYEVEPRVLAAYVDELAADPNLMFQLSERADRLAEAMSWRRLLPVYMETLETVAAGRVPAVLPPSPDAFTGAEV
jgi:glycosyltransferase involved in cell wall biosynthesis